MNIELRPITADNLYAVSQLDVHEGQKHFVAPNVYSVAESKFYPTWEPMGIYADDTLVGFVMWGSDPMEPPGSWWIIRLMIDRAYQGKGYGRAATVEAIRRIRGIPGCREIFLSFEPDNANAEKLYASLGFQNTGRVEDGEIVYWLALDGEA